MEYPSWVKGIKEIFGESILGVRESAPGELEITVSQERAHEVLESMKENFNHLADLTAYDDSPKSPRFYMVHDRGVRCPVRPEAVRCRHLGTEGLVEGLLRVCPSGADDHRH